jgi:hypothetical protein
MTFNTGLYRQENFRTQFRDKMQNMVNFRELKEREFF